LLTRTAAAKVASEQKMRAEMDQIMRLWDEAQQTSAAEVEDLQARVAELRRELAGAQSARRRAEAQTEDYSF